MRDSFFLFKLWLFIGLFLSLISREECNSQTFTSTIGINVLFYNVENLFDTFDDSLKLDEEFLPEGTRYWTLKKYNEKTNHIYKTLIASGTWDPPALIGLCEIENKKVLKHLVYGTPFSKMEYRFIHYESPDRRGIDVALLYRKEFFYPLFSKAIRVSMKNKPDFRTRDILYVKGVFPFNGDTLHIFVNHWPSRRGGQLESEYKRMNVARILRKNIDSLFLLSDDAAILIMGDFNDTPENKSVKEGLNVKSLRDSTTSQNVTNLAENSDAKRGSYKYQGVWQQLDQIMVSGILLNEDNSLKVERNSFTIVQPDFLLTEDEKNLGKKPFRTFSGYKYTGGFSDHLPVKVKLVLRK
jgi:predicted extracellular nuclease